MSSTEAFSTFYSGWISRQEEFLDELLTFLPPNQNDGGEERMNDLLSRVRLHYLEYFEARARLIETDVHSIACPKWLSCHERILLWIGGPKPSLTFEFVSGLSLTPNQESRVEAVRVEISEEEKGLKTEFDKIKYRTMAAPVVIEAFSGRTEIIQQMINDSVKELMEKVMTRADCVRAMAMTKVVEILDPIQLVKFYVEMAKFQLNQREVGLAMMGDCRH